MVATVISLTNDQKAQQSWIDWAIAALEAEQDLYERYEDYYRGDQQLEFATDRWVEAFADTFDAFADNWCQVVVDSAVQRLEITGWTTEDGDTKDSKLADEIWDANDLHVEETDLYTGTYVKGDGFMMVWPEPDGEKDDEGGRMPEVFYQDAMDCQVFYDPRHRRKIMRAAKQFRDMKGDLNLYIYHPDRIYQYKSTNTTTAQEAALMSMRGEFLDHLPSGWGKVKEVPNPYDIVPIFHFRNRSGIGTHGISELKSVIPMQNAVNKLLMDLLVASEFGSFRQKWIAGGAPPKNDDGSVGWRAGGNRVWHSTDPNSSFGEYGQIDLEPIFKAIDSVVGHIAKITQTPMHYLRTSGDMPSGEALKTAESGLVQKVEAAAKAWGSPWSKCMTFAVQIKKGSKPDKPIIPVWKQPETRHDLEQAQTAQLKAVMGVPIEQLWMEHFDYTQNQVDEFKKSNRSLAAAVLAQVVAQVGQLPPGSEKVTADPQALIELVKASPAVEPLADGESGLNVTQILALLGKGVTGQTVAGESTVNPQANTSPPASATRRSTGFRD